MKITIDCMIVHITTSDERLLDESVARRCFRRDNTSTEFSFTKPEALVEQLHDELSGLKDFESVMVVPMNPYCKPLQVFAGFGAGIHKEIHNQVVCWITDVACGFSTSRIKE